MQLIWNPIYLETNFEIFPATHATAIIIFILALLFLTAVVSGAEIAFFTLNSKDINYLKTKELNSSKKVIHLLDEPEILSSTLRASKYTFAIAIVIAGNYLANLFLPIEHNTVLTFVIILLSITFLLILIGEILPKVYARQNNIRMAMFTAPIVKVMFQFFRAPAKLLLVRSTDEARKKKDAQKKYQLEKQEYNEIEQASIAIDATQSEMDIFKGILRFSSIQAKQIMQPRLDISGIKESWNISKVREKIIDTGYSRMPVYKSNIDEISGLLYTKDLLPYSDIDDFDWHTITRPALFVHEHKLIDELLNEFQEKRVHMAIVVDEYGGTSGLVTLEDILEEIMGDIKDEYDEDDTIFTKGENDEYYFDGKMPIIDACRILSVPFSTFDNARGESDTVAGLILELAGKFANEGDELQCNGFQFTVQKLDGYRIAQVRVEKTATT